MTREKFVLGQDCLTKHVIAWTGWAIINDLLHFLICLLPPASIWFQTQEIFESEKLKIFDSFGSKPEPKKFLDKSWERAFLVCLILTLSFICNVNGLQTYGCIYDSERDVVFLFCRSFFCLLLCSCRTRSRIKILIVFQSLIAII
jgi:hypothetical protein